MSKPEQMEIMFDERKMRVSREEKVGERERERWEGGNL